MKLLTRSWSREARFHAKNPIDKNGLTVGPISELFRETKALLEKCGNDSEDIKWAGTLRLLETSFAKTLVGGLGVRLHQKPANEEDIANV